jgi:hypothetical protein
VNYSNQVFNKSIEFMVLPYFLWSMTLTLQAPAVVADQTRLTVATALDQLQPIDIPFDWAGRMNSQLRPISWMGMVFLPLLIPSILCLVSKFPCLRSVSLGVSHACSFTTR